ncbi:MAG: XRE family transcriptional regulator, partial [Chloroflexi bacterium]
MELSRRSNFSQPHISNVLKGRKKISWDLCAAIAEAFGERPEVAFRRV